MELFTLQALWAFLAIVLIDIVLAGDNALVIGMAANKLPPELRKKAIFWGTFGAIAIRFLSVAALTYLLLIPGLRAIGAAALIWIGWKLAFNNEEHNVEAKDTVWGAIGTIVVADAVMGIDNALGIAAAANGSFILVIAGLLISVPIILFGAGLVSKILEKYPDTVFIGSFVLFAVAMLMLMKEPLMAAWWAGLVPWAAAIVPWAVALVITAVQYNKARLHLHKKFLFKQDHQA
jgi:YjbE family integral membrane protein